MTTLEALEARVKVLECAVFGGTFRATGKDPFNDPASRLDLTTLEASLRAEMAALRSTVATSQRPTTTSHVNWDFDAAVFRYRTEARLESLERRVKEFEFQVRENQKLGAARRGRNSDPPWETAAPGDGRPQESDGGAG